MDTALRNAATRTDLIELANAVIEYGEIMESCHDQHKDAAELREVSQKYSEMMKLAQRALS